MNERKPMDKTIKVSDEVKEVLELWMYERYPHGRWRHYTYDNVIRLLIREHVVSHNHQTIISP